MDSFKTFAAVLLALLAFTSFQLIANHSLRRAVRNDVKTQIDSTDQQMLKHQAQLREAAELMNKLEHLLKTANSTAGAAVFESARLADSVHGLAGSVASLAAKIKTIELALDKVTAKLGSLESATDKASKTHSSLVKLQEETSKAEAGVLAASRDAVAASAAAAKLASELAEHKQAVKASTLAEMKEEIGRIRSDLQKVAATVDSLKTSGATKEPPPAPQ